MNKLVLIGIGLVGLSVAGARAEEAKVAAPAPEVPKIEKKHVARPELKDLTVVGKLEKIEKKTKDGRSFDSYALVGENGLTYMLRVPARKTLPGANIPELVGNKVKVVGKGEEGKRNIIPIIISIEKAEAAVAPVAAPEATPAAK